jgi:hypothetical protein
MNAQERPARYFVTGGSAHMFAKCQLPHGKSIRDGNNKRDVCTWILRRRVESGEEATV